MKKVTAILLLTIIVFNIIGYRLVILFVQGKADAALVSRLDKGNYIAEELVTIKVPVNLPYQNNWQDFERVDGEISFKGEFYRFVKCRIYNDTMTFLCIRNKTKTVLEQKATEYGGKVNDLPGSNSDKKADAFKQLFSDYDIVDEYCCALSTEEKQGFNLCNEKPILPLNISFQGQPPDVVS